MCRLVSQIARSDRRFEDIADFETVKDIGTLQRVTRQAQCVIDRRQNDVAYWKARVAALMGWHQGLEDPPSSSSSGIRWRRIRKEA